MLEDAGLRAAPELVERLLGETGEGGAWQAERTREQKRPRCTGRQQSGTAQQAHVAAQAPGVLDVELKSRLPSITFFDQW